MHTHFYNLSGVCFVCSPSLFCWSQWQPKTCRVWWPDTVKLWSTPTSACFHGLPTVRASAYQQKKVCKGHTHINTHTHTPFSHNIHRRSMYNSALASTQAYIYTYTQTSAYTLIPHTHCYAVTPPQLYNTYMSNASLSICVCVCVCVC